MWPTIALFLGIGLFGVVRGLIAIRLREPPNESSPQTLSERHAEQWDKGELRERTAKRLRKLLWEKVEVPMKKRLELIARAEGKAVASESDFSSVLDMIRKSHPRIATTVIQTPEGPVQVTVGFEVGAALPKEPSAGTCANVAAYLKMERAIWAARAAIGDDKYLQNIESSKEDLSMVLRQILLLMRRREQSGPTLFDTPE